VQERDSKEDSFFPVACWNCNKQGHRAMHCNFEPQGAEGSTDIITLSRDSEIAQKIPKRGTLSISGRRHRVEQQF
jgi:hypothetical protein